MKQLLFYIFFFSITYSHAQNEEFSVDEMSIEKSFLIIKSTKSYKSAFKTAKTAAAKLGIELRLSGIYDKENGLTNLDTCGCGEVHGYLPRGRFDDGHYASIEYSDYYSGFTKGYYIVIVSNGNRSDVKTFLPAARKYYHDAYIKNTKVYVGCMH